MNIPPERTGRMNASVAKVMAEAGKAINDTFRQSVVESGPSSGPCVNGVAVVELGIATDAEFDYVMIMEDLAYGQRFGNCEDLNAVLHPDAVSL